MISEARSVMRQICASTVFVIHLVIATFGVVVAPPAHAEGWRVGIYSGQWADTRLPYLPYNAATGRLTFSDSYLTSVIVSRHLLTRDLFIPYTSIGFSDARIEFEGTVSLHRGLQTHEEVTLGVMLRIPGLSGQGFRFDPATHSNLIRPPIPGHPATLSG